MHLVLSGEGNSDIGKLSYTNNTFKPAPMYHLIDKVIEQKLGYSFYDLTPNSITFIPKAELIKKCKSIRSFVGKNKKQETALFYKNAKGLSKIAKEVCKTKKDEDAIVVLFRDSDIHSHDKKIQSIENAFQEENIKGVGMIPKPKSEAWLICALKDKKYQNCKQLENRSGNDDSPNNLKDELKEILEKKNKEYYDINNMIKNDSIEIDINKIDMSSFLYFKNKLENLL
ncbi:MAG: hypothetical protein DRG78_19050 [Epsilonproteobacteria bacterium]|nr:MAG: hypothetical protein DRG78_19050 [Campylobacterota bacterium]